MCLRVYSSCPCVLEYKIDSLVRFTRAVFYFVLSSLLQCNMMLECVLLGVLVGWQVDSPCATVL